MAADENSGKDEDNDISANNEQTTTEVGTGGGMRNFGATTKNVMDTADVSRASISKGITGPEDVTAADIVEGKTTSDALVSYSTGIRPENGKVIEPDKEITIAKHLDNDIIKTNTEDISKVVSSGTTSDPQTAGIDATGMYSEDGTRHMDRAEQKPIEKVQDKETGSWKIKEKREK
jgi:hypothetical protein